MGTYAEEQLADFDSGLLPGELEGGLLGSRNRKDSRVSKDIRQTVH